MAVAQTVRAFAPQTEGWLLKSQQWQTQVTETGSDNSGLICFTLIFISIWPWTYALCTVYSDTLSIPTQISLSVHVISYLHDWWLVGLECLYSETCLYTDENNLPPENMAIFSLTSFYFHLFFTGNSDLIFIELHCITNPVICNTYMLYEWNIDHVLNSLSTCIKRSRGAQEMTDASKVVIREKRVKQFERDIMIWWYGITRIFCEHKGCVNMYSM